MTRRDVQRVGQHALYDGGKGELQGSTEASHEVGRLGKDVLAEANKGHVTATTLNRVAFGVPTAAVAIAIAELVE